MRSGADIGVAGVARYHQSLFSATHGAYTGARSNYEVPRSRGPAAAAGQRAGAVLSPPGRRRPLIIPNSNGQYQIEATMIAAFSLQLS